jgi:hypothetical protein
MASIYLSYRSGDQDAIAGRLHDQLVERFGRDAVVWRAPGSPPAERAAIEDSLRDTVVVVALVGPRWLRGSTQGTPPPLTRPDDPVRLELEAALKRQFPIVMALGPGGAPPPPPYLPPTLRPLAALEPLPLRDDPDFSRDVARLMEGLGTYIAPLAVARATRGISISAFALLGAVALLVIALSLAGVVVAARSGFGPFGAHSIPTTPTPTLVLTRTPTLVTTVNDPLTAVVDYGGADSVWVSDVYGYCGFVHGGYQVVGDAKPGYYRICPGPAITEASDERVTITTRLTAESDPNAFYGFYIRASDRTASDGYIFIITPAGHWSLIANSANPTSLIHGVSSAIHTGRGAVNTLALDAYGPTLTVLINGVKVGQVMNSDYTVGLTGLVVEHGATVVYTNLIVQRYE